MFSFSSPPLAQSTAHILSFAFSAAYVGSIYVSSKTRLSFSKHASPSANGVQRQKMSNERWRDDPDVIRARLTAVSLASGACCAGLWLVLRSLGDVTISDLFERLGLTTGLGITWVNLRPHLVTPILFLGPLYAICLAGTLPLQRNWSWRVQVQRDLFAWQGLRNVIFAPPTEEIVFRGCTLSVLHLAGVPRNQLIFLSPLSFGLAHVHHAWDVFNRYGRTSQAAIRALTVTLFQLTYTTLFGCYTAYLFLRTSSLYPAISAHMFCNFMGFPQITNEMHMFPNRKYSIILVYLLGIAGFVYTLPRWTDTPGSFYWLNHVGGRLTSVY